jgi:hypothetical protein
VTARLSPILALDACWQPVMRLVIAGLSARSRTFPTLLAPLMPARPESPRGNRRHSPNGGSCCGLAEQGANVKASQGWDQDLEDSCADNSAYCRPFSNAV